MPHELFELIELADGEIVLQRADDAESEPLFRIQISDEILHADSTKGELAKAMIEAAMELVQQERIEVEEVDFETLTPDADDPIH
ncbi:MAG: hypothetical protein K6L73_13765 [Cellvibrionaceae bacterium]